MRTTVDLPDDLFRRAKITAASRGQKFKDLVEEGLRRVLGETGGAERPPEPPSLHEMMKECCGIATAAPADYATNPKYLEGFGR